MSPRIANIYRRKVDREEDAYAEKSRRESATGFYHIVSRGLDRENIFGEKREKTRFLNLLKDNLNECNVEIYAYCVMSNHFHLLVKVEKEIMPIFMAKVLGRYAKYYNYKHNRIVEFEVLKPSCTFFFRLHTSIMPVLLVL